MGEILINFYLILGMNEVCAKSPSTALACTLKPCGRASLTGPVFFAGGAGRRLETARIFDCLLMRTMEETPHEDQLSCLCMNYSGAMLKKTTFHFLNFFLILRGNVLSRMNDPAGD